MIYLKFTHYYSNRFTNSPNKTSNSLLREETSEQLIPGSGIVQICDPKNPIIQFLNVPLCTPNGDILVQSINFTVIMGQNVIITGILQSQSLSVYLIPTFYRITEIAVSLLIINTKSFYLL